MIKDFYKRITGIFLMASFVLPVYPGAEKTDERQIFVNGINTKSEFYSTTDSPRQVLEFYKENLKDKFKVVQEAQDSSAIMFADKNNEGIMLNLSCYQDIYNALTRIQVSYNLDPWPQFFPRDAEKSILQQQEKTSQPQEGFVFGEQDVAGEDVFWLRRYSGSTRTAYVKHENGGFTASYIAKTDCLKCVVDYYRQELSGWGWTLEKEGNGVFKPSAVSKGAMELMPEKMAKEMEAISRDISSDPQLKWEYYVLNFNKAGEGNCTITFSMDEDTRRVIAVIQHYPARKSR